MISFFSHEFVRNALLACTGLAPACGVVGYFLVLRNQVFSGDALGHVAFTGAMGALALALQPRLGVFVATIAVALILGLLQRKALLGDVVTGTVFAWVLGLGVFALSWFSTHGTTGNAHAGPATLFGTIFGISESRAVEALIVGSAIVVLIGIAARPILFASVDAVVAAAQGVPVRAVNVAIMVAAGLCVAESVQVIGALLVLALLATPPATALRLTSNPFKALVLSMLLCLGYAWAGIAISYAAGSLPPGFVITALAVGGFALTYLPGRPARDW